MATENLQGSPCIKALMSSRDITCCLLMGKSANSGLNMGPSITPEAFTWRILGLHLISRGWEALSLNRTVSLRPLLGQRALAMVGTPGPGLNFCSGCKVLRGLTNKCQVAGLSSQVGSCSNEVKPQLLPGHTYRTFYSRLGSPWAS